jgi:CRP-like cAMP-binding protein
MSINTDKQICLPLLQEFMKILAAPESIFRKPPSPFPINIQPPTMRRVKFECSGCVGLIRFERKKKTTVQMQMINEVEKERKKKIVERICSGLRGTGRYDQLDDETLHEMVQQMQPRRYDENKMLVAEGMPGTHFYILLAGQAEVTTKKGLVLAKLKPGDLFGETSLLTGDPAYSSVRSVTPVQLLALTAPDFRKLTSASHNLNRFFMKIAMARVKENVMLFIHSGQTSSGISGELACINPFDLFQMINASGKTGKVDLKVPEGKGCVVFREGDIIYAACGKQHGKAALFAMLGWKKGTFIYTAMPLPAECKNRQIIGVFMRLMMEGMQYQDDQRRPDEQRVSQS